MTWLRKKMRRVDGCGRLQCHNFIKITHYNIFHLNKLQPKYYKIMKKNKNIIEGILSSLNYDDVINKGETKNRAFLQILNTVISNKQKHLSYKKFSTSEKEEGSIFYLLSLPELGFLVSCGRFPYLSIYNGKTIRKEFKIPFSCGNVIYSLVHLKNYNNNNYLISGVAEEANLFIADLSTKSIVRIFTIFEEAKSISYFPGDRRIFLSSNVMDKSIRVYGLNMIVNQPDDFRAAKCIYLNGHLKSILSMDFLHRGILASTGYDKTIRLWDLNEYKQIAFLNMKKSSCYIKCKDEKYLICGQAGNILICIVSKNEGLKIDVLHSFPHSSGIIWGIDCFTNYTESNAFVFIESKGKINLISSFIDIKKQHQIIKEQGQDSNLNHCCLYYDEKMKASVLFVCKSDSTISEYRLI
jgi:WD40 repeat protein